MENEFTEKWLLDLQAAYLATGEEKLSQLRQAVHSYLQNPESKDRQRKLHRLLHNLMGSGGSYGLPEVTSAARRMSDILRASRCSDWDHTASPVSPMLEREMERLRAAFSM